jgi:hypothetical protein
VPSVWLVRRLVPVSSLLTSGADCQLLGRLRASVDRRCLYSTVVEAVHDLVNSFIGG